MFGWLANMLVNTPVQGSGCGCCEAKKKELEKMQQALGCGMPEEESLAEVPTTFSSGSFRAHCAGNGESSTAEYYVKPQKESDECSGNCRCGNGGANCDGKGGCGCGGHH